MAEAKDYEHQSSKTEKAEEAWTVTVGYCFMTNHLKTQRLKIVNFMTAHESTDELESSAEVAQACLISTGLAHESFGWQSWSWMASLACWQLPAVS